MAQRDLAAVAQRGRADRAAQVGDEPHGLGDDRERRADPRHSPDAAALAALLSAYVVTIGLHAAGRLNARSVSVDLDGWWHGFFSYVASGPPPHRLRQVAALARAGVLRFLGADVHVEPDVDAGVFVATSASGPHQVRARGLVEARLPVPDLEWTSDVLLTRLRERGDVRAHRVLDGEARLSNGRLVETKENRDGTRTFHWKMETPHASYLTSIVVGEYVPIEGSYEGIPVISYVYPSEVEEGRVTTRRTPEPGALVQ